MRIVAGRHRGRVLLAPEGTGTRPTADRVREALFNILAHAAMARGEGGAFGLDGLAVLDAFAGSGALGLEALSRGAAPVSFFDTEPAALGVIGANIRKLGAEAQATLHKADATRPPKAVRPCRLILLDPPYKSGLAKLALPALAKQGWLAADARIVVEVAAGEPFTSPLPGWPIADERKYGAARLVFLEPAGQ